MIDITQILIFLLSLIASFLTWLAKKLNDLENRIIRIEEDIKWIVKYINGVIDCERKNSRRS